MSDSFSSASKWGPRASPSVANAAKQTGPQGFRFTTLFALSLLVGSVVFMFCWLFQASKLEQEAYATLMAESNPTQGDKCKRAPYMAAQQRRQVKKEIYFFSKGQHLQLQMHAATSTLRLHQQAKESILIEEMQDVKSYIQEELFYLSPSGVKSSTPVPEGRAMQAVCCCSAKEAAYYYQTQVCQAEEVDIARYIIPGHTLGQVQLEGIEPVMRGKAVLVEFSLGGGDLNFKATQLKATWNGA